QQRSDQHEMTEALRIRAESMEAEVFLRAQEIQEANGQLHTANAALERRGHEIAQLYEQLSELDRLKTQFFANVSHELRTPLTLTLGPIQQLLEGGRLSAQQRQHLEIAWRNTRVLHQHVNDLLDVAKLEAGKVTLDYEDVDFAELLRLTASYFEGL